MTGAIVEAKAQATSAVEGNWTWAGSYSTSLGTQSRLSRPVKLSIKVSAICADARIKRQYETPHSDFTSENL